MAVLYLVNVNKLSIPRIDTRSMVWLVFFYIWRK